MFFGLGMKLERTWNTPDSGPPIDPGDALLLENGDYLLLENGDKILLEA